MGGAAEEWRPGRGRRPGWGALSSKLHWSADGIRCAGGRGGPGSGRGPAAAAAAAAPSAPPGASGLGLRLRDPKASRSSLRRCCSSSCRCCLRLCSSCCHSPRPVPGRLQQRSLPGPRLHPKVGVAIPRRAGRAGGQRGHRSQARTGRSRPAPRRPPAAGWLLTFMLRGVRAPGGASLPVPSPSRQDSWSGVLRPDRPALCGGPVTATACKHVTNPRSGRQDSRRPGALGDRGRMQRAAPTELRIDRPGQVPKLFGCPQLGEGLCLF